MTNSGLYDKIGEDNICGSLAEAIERAKRLLGGEQRATGIELGAEERAS
jgi:hypothetical protein